MTAETRTSKSIKNAKVNLVYFFLQTIIGFWSRKVFYEYLGSEVLGIDTTANSLLQFLNIAESGIGMAVAYFLYAPFYNKDTLTINQIVTLQGWVYKRIASFILVVAIILMCFFPLIFEGIQVPLWYAYATFTVLLVGNLLGYYINYRQCVLAADQKVYKVTRVTQSSSIFFQVLLIICLPYVSYPFILYICTTFLGYIIGSIWLCIILKKDYPWLKESSESGRELIQLYPDVLKKTKQLFIHKVAGFAVHYCSPLIIYAFSNLTIIAFYGNYTTITLKVNRLVNQVFSSTVAAVGNLIASNDKERMLKIYWELTDSRLCITTILSIILFSIIDPFISLWLSPDYLLSKLIKLLIVIQSWLTINRSVIDSYKDGFGLFQDIWAPIVESILNIGIAIICGLLYGIVGVLLGGIVSNIVIVYGWKPYFLFNKGFNVNPIKYFFIPYIFRVLLCIISSVILCVFYDSFNFQINSFIDLFFYSSIISVITIFVIYLEFYICTDGMKLFHTRIVHILKIKFLKNN